MSVATNPQRIFIKMMQNGKIIFALFNPLPGALLIFDLSIELVQTSCGMGVPYYEYTEDRELLNDWAQKTGNEG